MYIPAKSKPTLPSFASMRDENWPPTRRSTVEAVVCQSSDAAFHRLMSSGLVHACQTFSTGAATVVSTVIFKAAPWLVNSGYPTVRRTGLEGIDTKAKKVDSGHNGDRSLAEVRRLVTGRDDRQVGTILNGVRLTDRRTSSGRGITRTGWHSDEPCGTPYTRWCRTGNHP